MPLMRIMPTLFVLFILSWWPIPSFIGVADYKFEIPLPILILSYFFSFYILVKIVIYLSRFTGKDIALKDKSKRAKEKCIEAMISYVGGDIQKGRELWKECSRALEKDPIFLLLGVQNEKYNPEAAQECSVLMKEIENAFPGLSFFFEKQIIEKAQGDFGYEFSIKTLKKLSQTTSLPWVFRALLQNHLSENNISEALYTLKGFWKSKHLGIGEWRKLRAKIFLKEAENGNSSKKYRLLKKANRLDPQAGVLELAEIYKKDENIAKARKVIESAWKEDPNIKMGNFYIDLDESDIIPIHRFQHAREIAKINEGHPISRILIATYAMEAELWGVAKDYLEKFMQDYPILAHILLARLEQKKNSGSSKIWNNIEKAFLEAAKKENIDADLIL